MKKIFTLILLACLSIGWGFSQSIQLIMSPRPSCYFSDWQNKTETIRMIVNNTSKAAIDCKIKTQLFNSKEEMIGETDFNKMPVLTLQPGISQFNAEDIYPLDAIKLFGNSLSSMLKTGRIPEDNYRLCTDLVDPVKGTPLTPAPQCKMFTIVDYQAPVLLSPREDDSIPEARIRGVIFRWTPVTPSANQLVIYRLQIWEVLDGQTKVDACRNNMPVYEKDLRAVLQTGWPVDFVPSEDQEDYVWSITAKDGQDRNLVTEGYGMAEPFGFTIGDAETPAKRLSGKGDGDVDLGPLWETLKTPALSSLNLVQVKLSQPSPNQLKLEELNIQLTNNAKEPVDVSLRGTVTITSNADMPTKAGVKPIGFGLAIRFILKPFPLPAGTTTITYDDIKTGDVKFESDEWAKAFGPGGILTPGDYEICVSVLDKSGKEIGKGCIAQKINGAYVPDTLAQKINGAYVPDTNNYYPIDGHIFSETDIKKPVTFRWIPVIPKPKDPVTYRLRVWQLMQGQNGAKAMEINQPLITKDVDNITQAVIYITGDFTDPELLAFVWNVQAFNKEGKLIGESLPSPKGWSGFRIEGQLGTNLKTLDACKDFKVNMVQRNKGDNGGCYDISITNNYRGIVADRPKSFRITANNAKFISASGILNGWTRTPSKFPPGSTKIIWAASNGNEPSIAIGETNFGSICLENVKTDPFNILYEWLNKDGKVICSGTIDLAGNSGSGSTGGGPGTVKLAHERTVAERDDSEKTIGGPGTIKLISPEGHGGTGDEGSGEEGDLITFKWSAPDIKGPFYIKIVEIKDRQSPDEAMQKNQAFFEQKNIDGTTFHYPESAPKFEAGKKYAWVVSCGGLESELWTFTIANGARQTETIVQITNNPPDSSTSLSDIVYPPALSHGGNPTVIQLMYGTLNNTSSSGLNVYVHLVCTTGGQLVVDVKSKSFLLPSGITLINSQNAEKLLYPIDVKYYDKSYPNADGNVSGIRTSSLPPGEYEICETLLNIVNKSVVGKNCYSTSVKNLTSVNLLTPMNNGLSKNSYPIFTWSKFTGTASESSYDIYYSLKIVEIIDEQSVKQEFTSDGWLRNKAFFVKGGISGQSFQYPADAPKLIPGKKYAWGIKYGNLLSEYSIFDQWGTKTASTCDMLNITPALQCLGNNLYSYTLTCQNTADPSTNPNGTVTLNTVSLLASNIPITITTGLPISIQPGQTSTISGQLGPVLLSVNLKFSIAYTCPTGSGIYSPEFTLPGKPLLKEEMTGPASVCPGQTDVVYSVVPVSGGASYIWSTTGAVTITSGLGTNSVTVNFGGSPGSASICVKAINDCGSGAPNCKSITMSTAPPAPVALNAGDNNPFYINLPNQFKANWTGVEGAIGYILEFTTNPSFMSSETRIVGAVNSYLVTGLTSNTTCSIYNYRVTALTACGNSAVSNVISVATFQSVPHGSWSKGLNYGSAHSFTVGAFGTGADIMGCPGQLIHIKMELWAGGGAGRGGDFAADGLFKKLGGNGGNGGGGGGYSIDNIVVIIPPATSIIGYDVWVGKGGSSHTDGKDSEVRLRYGGPVILKAYGGHFSKYGGPGSGAPDSYGHDGGGGEVVVNSCDGGNGGIGGQGGGPGNINHGGNGGHGGYRNYALGCTEHGSGYGQTGGAAGGDGKVVFTW